MNPRKPALGDLDRDSYLDVVIPYPWTVPLDIALGDGKVGFGALTPIEGAS